MKQTLLAAVIAGVAGSAAYAGSPAPYVEQPYMPPPIEVEPAADWQGFYIGLLGGMQNGELDFNPPLYDISATTYGAFAGYNFQMGKVVLGAEIDAQMGSTDISLGGVPIPNSPFGVNSLIDARARVGYSFGDVLAYAAGGYSTVNVDLVPNPDLSAAGWNAGAGVDFAITDKFFVGGEYIYRSMSGTRLGQTFDIGTHGFQARVGYRF